VPVPFLLLAFRFPPYDRIGAYRWSKLCGRLARLGHEIDVLCAPWDDAPDPGWFGDVRHEKIRMHRVTSLYPHRLRAAQPEARLLQKAQGRLFRLLDRVTPAHDIASLWGYRLLPAARRLLDQRGIPLIVATGAPFSANYWAARLKLQRPFVKLVQDFRDPWLMSTEELRTDPRAGHFELATRLADALVSVTPEMSTLYQRLSEHPRVVTVPNGVELSSIREQKRNGPRRYDFAYIGNLYNARDEPLMRFLAWLREKKRAGHAPRAVIAGLYPHHLSSAFKDLTETGHLTLKPHLPQEQAFELLAASKIALHLNGPGALGTFQTTTKLVEHAALGRPTLSLNYGGASDDFIRSHHLGWSLRADSATLFSELDNCWSANDHFEFDIGEFDFDSTARLYSSLLESVAADPLKAP
jgi:glycosyltransferase involved in cell wall biosynthesis